MINLQKSVDIDPHFSVKYNSYHNPLILLYDKESDLQYQ